MPNTGKPSKDCHLCRQRRVKCDLGRPACGRCIKYGAECPGYRNEQELVFRNANPVQTKQRKKRQTAKSARNDGVSSSTSSSESPPVSAAKGSSSLWGLGHGELIRKTLETPIGRSLNESWTTTSVPIILNVYSTLDFIQDIYSLSPEEGPLIWAAHLFSRTYMVNLNYSASIDRGSQHAYDRDLSMYLGKTLNAVNKALQTPEGATSNETLATVWILANYELLIGSLTNTDKWSPWHLHSQGLYSILKARGAPALRNVNNRMGFWPAYNMVQIHCLVTSVECPPESTEWFDAIRPCMFPGEAMALNVSLFVNSICHVCSRVLTMLRCRDFSAASMEYESLAKQLIDANQALVEYRNKETTNHPTDRYMRHLWHSALVKCFHIMQLYTNFISHYAPCRIPLEKLRADRLAYLAQVKTSAQIILDETPATLGHLRAQNRSPKMLFEALKLIWPLTSVYTIPSTMPEQKAQAELSLAFIGKELGIRQALRAYPGESYLPREAREPFYSEDETAVNWVGRLGGALEMNLED